MTNCNFCNGDEAVTWKDGENNAFVDSKGEMAVTIDGKQLRFSVKNCPMCGRRFVNTEEDYLFRKEDENETDK